MDLECPYCGQVENLRAEHPRRFDLPDPLIIECRECQ